MTQRTFLAVFRHSVLAVVILAFSACSSDNNDDDGEEIPGNSLLLNFASDYITGELRWMDPDSTRLFTGALSFGQDSKIVAHKDNIFVLERTPADNISCIDPRTIGNTQSITQRALEQSANAQDVAVAGGKGFIALWGMDYLQSFDVSTCGLGEKINLPISGANAASIHASGDTLLVVSQRLDNYAATKPGLLILINASNGALIDTIQLKLYNPGFSVLSKGKLYVSSIDDYGSFANAGIEVVDLATKAIEVLVTGAELGGGASAIALDEANQILYVSVYADYGDQPVKPVNLSSKNVEAALPSITDSFGGLVFDDVAKKLFVGDIPGLKIYDPATKLTTPVSEGANALPPSSLAIVRW
jgi:hypothetical protein